MIHSIIHRAWDTQNAGSREISFLRVSVGAMRVLSLSAREPEKTALASELRAWGLSDRNIIIPTKELTGHRVEAQSEVSGRVGT